MRKDWKIKTLTEISENLDSKRVPITKNVRKEGSIPYHGASGIVDYVADYLFDEDLLCVSEDGANLLARTYPIAFPITGKTWVNNHAHVLKFKDRISQKFIEIYLNSIKLDDFVSGMAQPKLNQTMLNKIPIPFPPLPEQKRIVSILGKAFAAIDKAKALAEKNLDNAKELFESYLQGVFENKKWQLAKLSSLTSDITDGDHMPPPKSETGLPFITISNINKESNQIDFSNTFKVPIEYFNKIKANRKPQKGDVLYTVTGSYGIPVLIEDYIEFCFQRHIGLIRPKKDLKSKMLFYWILSPQARNQANSTATGTAQKTVSLTALRNFSIPIIPENQQSLIIKKLDALSFETKRLEEIYCKKLNDLEDLKKSILHKAFNGEL
jgi:type I restriction enzyme S subunit